MPSLLLILLSLFSPVWSACDAHLLSKCTACCAMLFSAKDCAINDVFRVKVNGNGALGAIWDDSALAAVVRPGCLLELWDLRNQTGTHRAFGLDGHEVFPFDRYAFERRASSVRCTCAPTPPPTTTEEPVTEYEYEYHGDDEGRGEDDSNSTRL